MARAIRISIVVLTFVLIATAGCTSPATPRGTQQKRNGGGLIAFSDRGDIYVINADGSGRRDLIPDSVGSSDIFPSWSPDGSQILFTGERLSGTGLYVMRADGGDMLRVPTDHLAPYNPAWSPDARTIAFVGEPTRVVKGYLYVMRPDGSHISRLTVNSAGSAAWSPDGTWIVYEGPGVPGSSYGSGAYIIRADGTGRPRKLGGDMHEPAWSPDGRTIAFSRRLHGGGFDLFVIRPDGSGLARLTRDSFPYPLASTWSPDGTKIAFAGNGDFAGDLYVINADGSNLVQLTSDGLVSEPAWKPAG